MKAGGGGEDLVEELRKFGTVHNTLPEHPFCAKPCAGEIDNADRFPVH